jgi:hypothetical protein
MAANLALSTPHASRLIQLLGSRQAGRQHKLIGRMQTQIKAQYFKQSSKQVTQTQGLRR